mmetsp:Transcript_23575/g.42181  ORF Transcript_23575/g.42181 Transcript_23575/m.42181 type:complete len:98 (-) Transcript_23575:701-994(-)
MVVMDAFSGKRPSSNAGQMLDWSATGSRPSEARSHHLQKEGNMDGKASPRGAEARAPPRLLDTRVRTAELRASESFRTHTGQDFKADASTPARTASS